MDVSAAPTVLFHILLVIELVRSSADLSPGLFDCITPQDTDVSPVTDRFP